MPIHCRLCLEKLRKRPLYSRQRAPVLNNVVFDSENQARESEVGSICLIQCHRCGLVFNLNFEKEKIIYDARYDNTRSHSPSYDQYLDSLTGFFSGRLTPESRVIEIGCGNGDFIKKLSESSGCHAEGYDAAYRGPLQYSEKVSFSRGTFDKENRDRQFSLLILRHVLEHIPDLNTFLKTVSQSIPFREDAVLFVEVPDFEWILERGAYFDITYEHCNYFLSSTLVRCAAQMGFRPARAVKAYDNQYIVLEAERAGTDTLSVSTYGLTGKEVSVRFRTARRRFLKRISSMKNICVWGASGKGAIFLSDLPGYLRKKVRFAIDINPSKQGKFLPHSGIRIVNPCELMKLRHKPAIIIMNEFYEREIRKKVSSMGITASFISFIKTGIV